MSIPKHFDIYIPNEIFSDLTGAEELKSVHIPFTYCYYFYCCYLYRFCKFFDANGEKMTKDKIKQFLGYSPSYKQVNYIIKKDGVLDSLGYTLTTNDYPVSWSVDSKRIEFLNVKQLEQPEFMYSDRNFHVKKPIKAFYRHEDDIETGYLSGTFYEVMNTHKIPFAYFVEFMSNNDIGVIGFYIYAYLRYRCDKHNNEFQASHTQLSRELKMSDSTVKRYIKKLEEHSFVEVDHKPFDINLKESEREANVYSIL